MLVELSKMEQRYQAALEVIQDGWKVTEVAARIGVSRQSVHNWIARYEQGGLTQLIGGHLPHPAAGGETHPSPHSGSRCSSSSSMGARTGVS